MRGLKGIFKDELLLHSSLMFAATILGGLCNFLFQIYANRNLIKSDFSFLYNLMTLAMMVGVLGMTVLTMVAKQISHYRAKNETGKIAYLFVHILGKISLVAILGFLLYLPFSRKIALFLHRPDAVLAIVVTGILMALSFIIPVAYGTLQGLEKFGRWSLSMILFSLFRLFLGVLLIYLGYKIIGAITASVIAYIAIFVIISFWIKDLYFREEEAVKVSLIDFYKTSWWIVGSFLFGNIICFIDILLVQHFLEQEAPYYSSASMLGRTIFYLPWALAASMFPKISALCTQKKSPLPLLKRTLLYSLILCSVAALTMFIFSEFIVSFVLHGVYLETVPALLKIFVFALIPYALITILVYFNIAAHRVKVVGFLFLLAIFHIVLLSIFHMTLKMIILTLAASGTLIFVSLLFFTFKSTPEIEIS